MWIYLDNCCYNRPYDSQESFKHKDMDYSVLSDKDKSILDAVIKKFKNYKAQEIVDYMHEEKAYQGTNPGEIIPFSMAKEIRAF